MNEMDSSQIPKLLINQLSDAQLAELLKALNKTRRRFHGFSLNGRMVWSTRRWARDFVAGALASRKERTAA